MPENMPELMPSQITTQETQVFDEFAQVMAEPCNPEPASKIAAKLLQVMQTCGYIQKSSENKEQKYKYVSAAAVMDKINPALVEARLVSIPEFSLVSEKEKSTSRGGVWQLITVQLRLTIIDVDSGESLTIVSLGTGTDPGDKATSKAQTAALKYAWLTALQIETGDEPEADARTDQQVFMAQGQAPQAQAQLPNSTQVPEIIGLWQQIGWDTGALPTYLEQRFNKPASQVTDVELIVINSEARQYLAQKGQVF